jgi:sRNA-binding carbon storage regulator CsrA
MKEYTLRVGEEVVIDGVLLTVLAVEGDEVTLALSGPGPVSVGADEVGTPVLPSRG